MNALLNIKRNFAFARHHWQSALLFGLFWGVFLAAHAFANLYLDGWQNMLSIAKFASLMFIGASIGGAIGWILATILGAHQIPPKRFAIGFLIILFMTLATTVALYALQYRIYYAQWHFEAFTIGWVYQLIFTTASAVYLFAVLGLRTILPFGPAALFVVALIFTRLVAIDNDDRG